MSSASSSVEPIAPRRRPRARATSLLLAFAALGIAGYLLWDQRAALAYYVGGGAPVDLGAPGSYRLAEERDNTFARVEGAPGSAVNRFSRLGTDYEIVALQGTNLLIRRSAAAAAARTSATSPEGAGPRVVAEGRLLADRSIPEYSQAFAFQVQQSAAQPIDGRLYVLLDGDRPWAGWQTPALVLGLAGLVALNLASVLRRLRR